MRRLAWGWLCVALAGAALAGGARASAHRNAAARHGPAAANAAVARHAASPTRPTPVVRPGATGSRHVLVATLEGVVSPVMDEALAQALARARRDSAAALVLEIDTPGGLESSMRTMVQRLLASPVPVIAYVTPSGAHAASAGVFIVMACDVAAMSPGTNIGAATPISLNGPMDSTLARKATNDAAAFAHTVAAQRGRNARWAERAVREAVSIGETEAVQQHVVDFVAGDLDDVLARADSLHWRRGEQVGRMGTKGLPVTRIERGFRQRLLAHVADPNVAYLLMMLGFYGLIFELQNPGSVLPGVVGGICLLLAFFALSTLPVNSAGVALVVLGLGFLLAEIKVQSHGVLAVGGTIAITLGALMLFQSGTVHVDPGVIAVATTVTVLFFLGVIGAGLRAGRLPVVTSGAGLVGQRGVVVERLAPSGLVRIGGEVWNATSEAALEAGAAVEVVGSKGLMVRVRSVLKEG